MQQEKYTNEAGYQVTGFVLNSKLMEAAYFDPRLQNETRAFLGLLVSKAYDDGLVKHLSIKKAAKTKGVKRWAIQNQIKKLIGFGYLALAKKGTRGNTNQYKLLYDNYRSVTQLDYTPSVTPSDYTGVTSGDYSSVIQSDYPKKTQENKEIKKEKRARSLDDFLLLIEGEGKNGLFGDLKPLGLAEIKLQAIACWEHWEAAATFPEGNMVSALKGWIRTGIQRGVIKIRPPSNEHSASNVHKTNLEGLAEWKIALHSRFGEAVFNAWIKNLELDEQGDLIAPNTHAANWVSNNYMKEIIAVLPNVSNIYVAKGVAVVN